MVSKVVMNYDNLPSAKYYFGPETVIIGNEGNASRDPCYMADTIYLMKGGRTQEEVRKIAKRAAPLATKVILADEYADHSHDMKGRRAYAYV